MMATLNVWRLIMTQKKFLWPNYWIFFEIIDPYSLNQQGFDKGEKYRTGIYSQKAEPLLVARQYIDAREDADKIRVEVKPLTNYIASALIHQNHLDIYPEDRYLCHLPTAVLNRYRKTQPVQDWKIYSCY